MPDVCPASDQRKRSAFASSSDKQREAPHATNRRWFVVRMVEGIPPSLWRGHDVTGEEG
jgi:hypothetical protein